MFQFLLDLFATKTDPARTACRRARLAVTALEDRSTPAAFTNPGVIHGFNPQPDPPAFGTVAVSQQAQTHAFIIIGVRALGDNSV